MSFCTIASRHIPRRPARPRVHHSLDESRLAPAAALLNAGGVVAIPTETVYGLAADALNPVAVARIFEIKRRPHFDPLIIHLASAHDLIHHPRGSFLKSASLPSSAQRLIDSFWEPAGGPLTLIFPKSSLIPDLVTAGLPSAAFRVPAHPLTRRLIQLVGSPLAAPSANPFGAVSPTTAQHVRDSLGSAPDLILDGGPCASGVESTVLSFADPSDLSRCVDIPTLLRPGALPVEDIERVVGPVGRPTPSHASRALPQSSPGLLASHYATRAPIRTLTAGAPIPTSFPPDVRRPALLAFQASPAAPHPYIAVEVLSPHADLRDAAANLFAALRRLDAVNPDLILAQLLPDHGLGLAVNDRLSRAAAPRHRLP